MERKISMQSSLEHLHSIATTNIVSLLLTQGEQGRQLPTLCSSINDAIDMILDPAGLVDLNDPKILQFLKETLPCLTEAIIRKKNLRENVEAVVELLKKIAALLARPAAHDIVELMELRNMLMTATIPQHLKFIDPKQIRSAQSLSSHLSASGFFWDYGRPCTALFSSNKTVSFWEDEWNRVLGGSKAIGHMVQVFLPGSESTTNSTSNEASLQSQSTPSHHWVVGRVEQYTKETDSYGIRRILESSSTDSSTVALSTEMLDVQLNSVRHCWVDLEYRTQLSALLAQERKRLDLPRLQKSNFDVGSFVRVWWSRYNKYYYGRIVKYDVVSKHHSICYEDNDIRTYDMDAKEYEIINVPTDVFVSLNIRKSSDSEGARLVAKWHREMDDSDNVLNEKISSRDSFDNNAKSVPQKDGASSFDISFIARPTASAAYNISLHQLTIINEYFREGGAECCFQSLCDDGQSPPVCRILVLHLQLVFYLRSLANPSKFADLVWELKEGIPWAMLRFEELQTKDLTIKDVNEVLLSTKDLIVSVASASNVQVNQFTSQVHETLELMRLSVSAKLLVCSQLQKRYLGLSMIKEVTETILPKMEAYLSKQYNALNLVRVNRGASVQRYQYGGTQAYNSSTAVFKSTLTGSKMDAWLVDMGIVEVLFGESLHHDLAAKSDVILTYMAHRKLLSEAHIDTIWNASRGAHEAVVRVLFNLLLLITPVLEQSIRSHLFGLMSMLPTQDYTEQILNLIKSFTVHALLAMRDESNVRKSNGSATGATTTTGVDNRAGGNDVASSTTDAHTLQVSTNGGLPSNSTVGSASSLSTAGRKGLVVNSPQRQWLGFGLLWKFVQDEVNTTNTNGGLNYCVDEGLIDLAIKLLVELLEEEFRSDRELVMQRCLDNIQREFSVAVSLRILRRTLALYPVSQRGWFNIGRQSNLKVATLSHQIEKLIKNSQLLDIFFSELDSYHRSMASKCSISRNVSRTNLLNGNANDGSPHPQIGRRNDSYSDLNDGRVQSNGKISRISHLKGVTERLNFLHFIISWSPVALNEQQTMILWNAFGEDAATIETTERLFLWLNSLVNNQNKAMATLLHLLSQESDLIDQNQQSRLAVLAPTFDFGSKQERSYDVKDSIVEVNPAVGNSGPAVAESFATFDDNVLSKLFEERIIPWAFRQDKIEILSRPSIAVLCFKMLLLVNLATKAMRLEAGDTAWCRSGQLIGLPLLWRIAMDSKNEEMAACAITLLVELHHRTPEKAIRITENIKNSFLRMCFKQLYLAMQSLHVGDTLSNDVLANDLTAADNDTTETSAEEVSGTGRKPNNQPVDMTSKDGWFNDGDVLLSSHVVATRLARLVTGLRIFVQRYFVAPTTLHNIRILTGRDESLSFTLTMKASETVRKLRSCVAKHFKESPVSIIINVKATNRSTGGILSSSNSIETLDRDDVTLQQLRFPSTVSIVARKKEQQTNAGSATAASNLDLFQPQDLSENLSVVLKPIQWISSRSISFGEISNLSNSTAFNCLFLIPEFPMRAAIITQLYDHLSTWTTNKPENNSNPGSIHGHTGDSAHGTSIHGVNPSRTSSFSQTYHVDATNVKVVNHIRQVIDQLLPFVKNSPQYIDQLLEMLDGYLAANASEQTSAGLCSNIELSAAVWDIVQMLPRHPDILLNLKTAMLENIDSLPLLLSLSSPYRLLYYLEIMEKTLSLEESPFFGYGDVGKSDPEIVVNFHLSGGTDYIMRLLNELIGRDFKLAGDDGCDTANHETSKSPEDHFDCTSSAALMMPRKDLSSMLLAMLLRILYRLLMLDPIYSKWHCYIERRGNTRAHDLEHRLPAGVVMSCVDPRNLFCIILNCLLIACTRLEDHIQITPTAMQALAQNGLLLALGLLTTCSEVIDLVVNSEDTSDLFFKVARALCVKCKYSNVRQVSTRAYFEACANLINRFSAVELNADEKKERAVALDIIYGAVMLAIFTNRPHIIHKFSAEPDSQTGSEMGAMPHSEMKFWSVRYGEQIYSCIAAIETLRMTPDLIFSPSTEQASHDTIVLSHFLSMNTTSSCLQQQGKILTVCRSITNLRYLAEVFIHQLVNHSSSERFHSSEVDSSLVGLLRVMLIFASGNEEMRNIVGSITVECEVDKHSYTLIEYLYARCLFPTTIRFAESGGNECKDREIQMAVCQTQSSRELVYGILFKLCDSSERNYFELMRIMRENQKNGGGLTNQGSGQSKVLKSAVTSMTRYDHAAKGTWDYDPGSLLRDPDAYVGLCNQGGTCYMNSFVQQLFHVPHFTEKLLQIDALEGKNEEDCSDNQILLFQMQVMFGYLQLSQKRYYDTLPFCQEFKDYDNEPISLTEQKDINEFAGMLFDKMESNSAAESLLSSTLQGKIVWKTTSLETPYRSEREENFYMITAEVKGKTTLEDSLDLFITEELFSGDNKIEDSDTGRKVDALRRCAIRKLPPTLIIHLKRFEFDLETMNRKKVNDRISFPHELDMFPYTEEGIAAKERKLRSEVEEEAEEIDPAGSDEAMYPAIEVHDIVQKEEVTSSSQKVLSDGHYKYQLKGVVAHVGAIDRGHYYSFIKERTSERWLEFNDRTVLPFSPEAIPCECFGGVEEYTLSNGSTNTKVRENNAYLLFYERIEPSLEKSSLESTVPGDTANAVADALNDDGTKMVDNEDESVFEKRSRAFSDTFELSLQRSMSDTLSSRGTIATRVLQTIWKENVAFQCDRFLFCNTHFAFMWQILQTKSLMNILDNSIHSKDDSDADIIASKHNMLQNLGIMAVRFIVEVLTHARAHSCIHLFFERLEDIIIQDESRNCADAVLKELSSFGMSPDISTISTDACSSTNDGIVSARAKLKQEQDEMEKLCHPWLLQMLVHCPHVATVKAFARFLMTCVKAMRSKYHNKYLDIHLTPSTDGVSSTNAACVNVAGTEREQAAAEASGAKNRSETNKSMQTRAHRCLMYESPVSQLFHKLVLIAERSMVDPYGRRENYQIQCGILYQFAQLGADEKHLLVELGTISRMVCSVLSMNPMSNQIPEEQIRNCIDLIAMLVQNTGLSSNDEKDSTSLILHVTTILETEDLQAFLNRIFLEQAVTISTTEISNALQHVCSTFGLEETCRILEHLTEKVIEATMPNSGTNLMYRPYFKVLSEILMGPAHENINEYQSIIHNLANKMHVLAHRQLNNDAEYVYAMSKLLHRLGTSSANGNIAVMQVRSFWRDVPLKYAHAKRAPSAYSANATIGSSNNVNQGRQHGAADAGSKVTGQSLMGKAFSSATSFLNS